MPDIFDTVAEEPVRDIFDEVEDKRPKSVEFGMGVPLPSERTSYTPQEESRIEELKSSMAAREPSHPIRETIQGVGYDITHPVSTLANAPQVILNAITGQHNPLPMPPGFNPLRVEVPPDANIRPALRPYAEGTAEVASSVTDPNVLATLPFVETKIAGVPSALGKLYVAQMASQIPKGAVELKRILDDPNVSSDDKKKAATEYALLVGGTALGAKGATLDRGSPKYSVPKEVKESAAVLPKAAAEVAKVETEQPTTPEVPSASSEQKTAEVHGSLRPQPVEGQGQMPTQEGGGGVQPSSQKAAGEVLLKPALKVGDKVYPAEGSETSHIEIETRIKAGPQPDLTGLEEGFVDASGKFIDRKTAAKETGLPTGTEPGKLHSSDLSEKPIAVRLEELKALTNPTPSEIAERDALQTKSDAANKGRAAWGDFGGLNKPVEKPAEPKPQKYRVGNSPQTYTLVERLPQSEVEKGTGEQPVRVKNDKTGKVETMLEGDLTPVQDRTGETKAAKRDLDAELKASGLEPSVFNTDKQKRDALKRQYALKGKPKSSETSPPLEGPGAAAYGGSDIGAMVSNIPPLEKLADAVKDFPKQEGSWREALNQWLNDIGVPIKDFAGRALASSKAATARVISSQHELPSVTSMDRDVGKWNKADTEMDLAAQRFSTAVRKVFKDRSKLRALSNWIDAAGDKELLRQRAEGTKDPALRKTYEDASKFGPDEEKLAREIQQYHDEMLAWAQREGALEEGLENYLHRYYKPNDPVLEKKLAAVRYLRFTKDFNGFKKRFYASDFDAEQAGLSPEKDAARRILAYDQGFRKALTARAFVKGRYEATMKDGRPELDIAGMGVRLEPSEEGGRTVTLIKPKWKQNSNDPMDYRGDYVPFDHPAFRKHKWVSSDENGNPVLVQGDILVHPDAVKQYNALFGKSWWKKNPIGRALLAPSNVVKQTMLSVSAFHPVQIGIHAIEHKTNPFKLVDLNVRDPAQAELVEGGLTIADTSGSMAFSEGVGSGGGLLGKIPFIGEQLRLSNDWLFKDFIPRIKMTMALDALERNQKRYAKQIASGEITREQLVRLTSREANAAFGEQNYRAMFRNPTFQDTLRFLFLAPDFGEARLKFPLQALTKYGGEQRMALILGALGMATVAKLVEKELTGQVNWKRPFTVTYNDREYGLRNVASDLYHLVTDPSGYIRNRLNPIYTRAALEALSGRDAFGRRRTAVQQLADEAKTIVPISARGLTDREQRFWESFMNAMGLTERRRSSFSDAMKNVNAWKKKMGYENAGEFVYDADKDPYHPLTQELTFGNDERALAEVNKLVKGKSVKERLKIFDHYQRALGRARYLTGSKEKEAEYVKTLQGEELAQYKDALKERQQMWLRFQRVWNKKTI